MKSCIFTPEILLPAPGVDLTRWAAVACDQYTSEPEYWEAFEAFVGDKPSALRCTFPEVWLGKGEEARIRAINAAIESYVAEGVFRRRRGMTLVERRVNGKRRIGVVLAVDLEAYSFRAEDHALIRATEGTILERIPPRVRIREHAKAEFPHIMLLADDRGNRIMGGLYRGRESLEKIYDFELYGEGGHLTGWFIEDTEPVIRAFESLLAPEVLREKYGSEERILFAVGDGNHSLATAKTCWEQVKAGLSEKEQETHPARFALCEVVSIYDEGLVFEPIHRVVKGVDNEKFAAGLSCALSGEGSVEVLLAGGRKTLPAPSDTAACYRAVQDYIDGFLAAQGGEVDYIHGAGSLAKVAGSCGGTGILMPALDKSDLFGYVATRGALPRKTFSMGEANEKRFYLEGRLIRPDVSV